MKKTIVALLSSLLLLTVSFAEDVSTDIEKVEAELSNVTEEVKSSLETKGLVKVKKEEIDKVKSTRNLKSAESYAESKRWAMIIGINDFEDKFIADLSNAQNDAKVLGDVLKNEGQFDHVWVFTDDNPKDGADYPKLNNIKAKMEFLKNEIKPEDTLLVSFSGHGISDDNGKNYLVMADSVIAEPFKTSLPLSELQSWIEDLQVNKNIVLLDACRNVVEKAKSTNNTRYIIDEKNSQAAVSAVFYSTSYGEYSYENDNRDEPYGVFTTYIMNGLKGKADRDEDFIITFDELRGYVESGVKDWALNHNVKQKPWTSIKGEFHGDVALSVIPIKPRKPYNPNALENSYKKQLGLFQGLNYGGIVGLTLGLTSAAVGGILFGVGYSQYSALNSSSSTADWATYKNLTTAGLWTMIAGGSVGVAFTIPLGASFGVKPKKK